MIQATERSGSNFFNCKKCFSIFSLVVFDATYEFTLVDIDEAWWQSNSGIFSSSNLGQAIDQNIFKFPEPATTNNYVTTKKLPYLFVTDEALSLKPFMLQ